MHLVDKVTLRETSESGPSGAWFRGRRYVAWRGQDNQVNVVVLNPNGGEGDKITTELTISDPQLFVDGDHLSILWTGTDKHLNVANIAI